MKEFEVKGLEEYEENRKWYCRNQGKKDFQGITNGGKGCKEVIDK